MTVAPRFDPELQAILDATGQTSVATGITANDIPARRAEIAADVPTLADLRADGRFDVEETVADGVSLLIVRRAGSTGHRPVVYFTHGGGLVMGSNRYGLGPALEWVAELDVVLVSVEYRLAPEVPYPGGMDDAYTGLSWTAAHAADLGGDAGRLVLAGASAGGTLAAALALLARDRGEIAIAGQLLTYPMLDDRNDSASGRQMVGLGVWDRVSNATGWQAYLAGVDEVPPYAAPARATDLSGLPSTYVEVGSAETFRDEVVEYALRMWQAGVRAELHVWEGAYHGFDVFAPDADVSRRARTARLQWLHRTVGPAHVPGGPGEVVARNRTAPSRQP